MLSFRENAAAAIICGQLSLLIVNLLFAITFAVSYMEVIDCHDAAWPLNIAFWVGPGLFYVLEMGLELAYWALLSGTLYDPKYHQGVVAAWTMRFSVGACTAFAVFCLAVDLANGNHSNHLITHQQAFKVASACTNLNAIIIAVTLYAQCQTEHLSVRVLTKAVIRNLKAYGMQAANGLYDPYRAR